MQTRSKLDLTNVTLEDLCKEYSNEDDESIKQKRESKCSFTYVWNNVTYVWNNVFLVNYIVPLYILFYFLSIIIV